MTRPRIDCSAVRSARCSESLACTTACAVACSISSASWKESAELRRGASLPTWQQTRLNARYHGALRLSEIILRYAAAEPGPGGIEVASFVVTMWDVFEQFVTTALAEALRHAPGRVQAQMPAKLAGPGDWHAGSIPMKVDVVYRDVYDRPRVVFDAKYKAASSAGEYANADHYQMLAYCTALRVPRAWLVYAGGSTQRIRRIKNTTIDVVEFPLDLARSPEEILARIDQLARQAVTEHVDRPKPARAEAEMQSQAL